MCRRNGDGEVVEECEVAYQHSLNVSRFIPSASLP